VAKAKLSLIVPNDSNSHLVCVGVRAGNASKHQEKLYNLGDSGSGGKVGLIRMVQEWARTRNKSFVAVKFDGIRKEQETHWTLLVESIKGGKGTLAAGVEYYHQFRSCRNAAVFLSTHPPYGGHCLVDYGMLLSELPDACVRVKNMYSDNLAAAVVSPRAFEAIEKSSFPMWKRYGTAIYNLGMKCWQMGLDNRDPATLAGLRCWWTWLGLFLLNSHRLHADTASTNVSYAICSLIELGREADLVKRPHRCSTHLQEGYHGELRTHSHKHEVTHAQLFDLVQSYRVAHTLCDANGWQQESMTVSGAAASGSASRLMRHRLPDQVALTDVEIIAQGRSAATVAEKLLCIGGWEQEDMTEWIQLVRKATSLRDFLPVLERLKHRAMNQKENDQDCELADEGGIESTRAPSATAFAEVSAADPDDAPIATLAGEACAVLVGTPDPMQSALDAMAEEAKQAVPFPDDPEMWQAPTSPIEVGECIQRLAKLNMGSPSRAQDALAAIVAVGKLEPQLPKGTGQKVDREHKVPGALSNLSISGRFIRESSVKDSGTNDEHPASTSQDRFAPGCVILKLGTPDFYYVEVMSKKYGTKYWLWTDDALTDAADHRLFCSKLALISASKHNMGATGVQVMFRRTHCGLHRIAVEDAVFIYHVGGIVRLYSMEESLSAYAQPTPGTDKDKIIWIRAVLKKLSKLTVTRLQKTATCLIGALTACDEKALNPQSLAKTVEVLQPWSYHPMWAKAVAKFSPK
jgi:hypothetical protein